MAPSLRRSGYVVSRSCAGAALCAAWNRRMFLHPSSCRRAGTWASGSSIVALASSLTVVSAPAATTAK
eukprot:CAMPEP_0118921658 /NCGR_PEP_ID=MMETSP1169-20130426/864_1 /TAXON_ID=36882 /ORGANISM="Pyramimonas obovata, Strain CCMP722" /LENGTH=67 /DNA_ID=CAMNT_0006862419 /DNA_START=199 /DNA_END=402 /DNA_ORIENTATION=-